MKKNYEVRHVEGGKYWSPDYRGIAFDTEKELHDWVKAKHRKEKWHNFTSSVSAFFNTVFTICVIGSIIVGGLYICVKTIKFFWNL